MRLLPACLLVATMLAGCAGPAPSLQPHAGYLAAKESCAAQPPASFTLYLGPGNTLRRDRPEAGVAPGNGFRQGFLTNDLLEWLGEPVPAGLHLDGNVGIELWVRSEGTPAPLAVGGEPGTAYHLFNQFGSDRTLQPAYAVEYDSVAPEAGSVAHYNESLQLAAGGFVLEPGDRPRLLLTGLTLDGADGPGQSILYGGDTPSQVRFTARCWLQAYTPGLQASANVTLLGNQGLLTGAVPATEGVNRQSVPLALPRGLARLSIELRQTGGPTDPKSDMDLAILDRQGKEVWSIGSPYTDERGVLWGPNLVATLPPGHYTVAVNAYSGGAYQGVLSITQEWPLERSFPAPEPA